MYRWRFEQVWNNHFSSIGTSYIFFFFYGFVLLQQKRVTLLFLICPETGVCTELDCTHYAPEYPHSFPLMCLVSVTHETRWPSLFFSDGVLGCTTPPFSLEFHVTLKIVSIMSQIQHNNWNLHSILWWRLEPCTTSHTDTLYIVSVTTKPLESSQCLLVRLGPTTSLHTSWWIEESMPGSLSPTLCTAMSDGRSYTDLNMATCSGFAQLEEGEISGSSNNCFLKPNFHFVCSVNGNFNLWKFSFAVLSKFKYNLCSFFHAQGTQCRFWQWEHHHQPLCTHTPHPDTLDSVGSSFEDWHQIICKCVQHTHFSAGLWCRLFRWFEEVVLLKGAQFFKQGELKKTSTGNIYQKYVLYTCFIVKMRINLWSFGLFRSIWFEDNAQWRKMLSLNSWVLQVKKFKFGGAENLGHAWTNWSVSQKVQIFGERSTLMKCSVLHGCLKSSIWLLIIKKIIVPLFVKFAGHLWKHNWSICNNFAVIKWIWSEWLVWQLRFFSFLCYWNHPVLGSIPHVGTHARMKLFEPSFCVLELTSYLRLGLHFSEPRCETSDNKQDQLLCPGNQLRTRPVSWWFRRDADPGNPT